MDKSPLPLSKRRKLDGVVEDDDVGCLRSSVKECIIHASPDKKKKLRALLVAIDDDSTDFNIHRDMALAVFERSIKKKGNDIAMVNQLCLIVASADNNVGSTAAIVNNDNGTTVMNAKTSETTNNTEVYDAALMDMRHSIQNNHDMTHQDNGSTNNASLQLKTPHASNGKVTHTTPHRVTPTMLHPTNSAKTNQTSSTRSNANVGDGGRSSMIESIRQRLPISCSNIAGAPGKLLY